MVHYKLVVIVRFNCRRTRLRCLVGCDFYRRGSSDGFATFACGFGVSLASVARVADVLITLALHTIAFGADVVARCRIFIADVSD